MGGRLLVGLIGAGIQRSLSPAMHEREAARHGVDLRYQLIDLDGYRPGPPGLPALVDAVRAIGFAGFNVTYPCKQAVVPLLDELDPEARAIGAVNTVVIRDDRLVGHNTDASGWVFGLRRHLPGADLGRVVLLGAGGAGVAIAHAAMGLGVGRLRVVDREPQRAAALAAALVAAHGRDRATAAAEPALTAAHLQDATGLIHATPTGMAQHPGIALDPSLLHAGLWVSEVVYSPIETDLLRAARERGCRVADGGGMAVGQAVGAFRLFTGLEPDAARMEADFRELLAERGD